MHVESTEIKLTAGPAATSGNQGSFNAYVDGRHPKRLDTDNNTGHHPQTANASQPATSAQRLQH